MLTSGKPGLFAPAMAGAGCVPASTPMAPSDPDVIGLRSRLIVVMAGNLIEALIGENVNRKLRKWRCLFRNWLVYQNANRHI